MCVCVCDCPLTEMMNDFAFRQDSLQFGINISFPRCVMILKKLQTYSLVRSHSGPQVELDEPLDAISWAFYTKVVLCLNSDLWKIIVCNESLCGSIASWQIQWSLLIKFKTWIFKYLFVAVDFFRFSVFWCCLLSQGLVRRITHWPLVSTPVNWLKGLIPKEEIWLNILRKKSQNLLVRSPDARK